MPYVSLDDEELVDMILERPHLISVAVQKLQEQCNEYSEDLSRMYDSYYKQREEIKELKKLVDKTQS